MRKRAKRVKRTKEEIRRMIVRKEQNKGEKNERKRRDEK